MLDLFKSREHFTNHPIIVSDHISRFFPDDEVKVFHEILSLDLHMDVYFIESKKIILQYFDYRRNEPIFHDPGRRNKRSK